MSRARKIIDKIPKVDGQDDEEHDEYHDDEVEHKHKPGG
jgi:hypothetical protein